MFNTQVQEGRLIASSPRLRLVYEPPEQKGIHPAEASDATAIKQQGQGEEVLSGLDCKGLVGGEKMYCMPLQFGVRLAIIVWFRRLA
ncbi:MAG: hypothetical protein ABSC21_17410 [Terriglobia bacterium]|jgi:hypothetical protein